MRRKISLYIAGKRADLDDQSLVLFNYTMEDIESPTVVRNSYSQQITLPGTATNNAIFGSFFRLDRVTGTGFNPLVRTPFKIFDAQGELLAAGYCKLDNVQSKGEYIHSYSVTLFGSLGGYFYDLMYNSDGTQMNLGDLSYKDADGNDFIPNETTFDLTATNVHYAWLSFDDGYVREGAEWYNVLNFAPAYNGLPSDFDTKKVLVTAGIFKDITSTGTDDRPHPSANNTYLVTMATDKTADEVRDYRAYLQRPVLSVSAFINAMLGRGGLDITSQALSRIDNNLWLTLPLPQRMDSYTDYPMSGIFSGSMSPADLLISLAKSFGLVFDTADNVVTMMTRDEWFEGGDRIDLSRRASVERETTPVAIKSKWYLFQNGMEGEFAEQYKKNWGREYAEQRVNTGYEFDASSTVITDLKTKGAVQYLEQSQMFRNCYNALGTIFPAVLFEDVSFVGYNTAGTESKTISLEKYLPAWMNTDWYNDDHHFYDVFDKPQLYGSGKKEEDGSGILLYYTGLEPLPDFATQYQYWHVTDDDTTLFNLLNDGKPCWDMRYTSGQTMWQMPHFSRYYGQLSLDWGTPQELGVPGIVAPPKTLYSEYWRRWIAALYDKDTMVVRRKVNLDGMQIGQRLMRNEYWFGNQRWRLNKISNHSMTSYDMTQCEFVRITDVPDEPIPETPFVELQDHSASVVSTAMTANVSLKSSGAWKVLSYPSWVSNINPSSGETASDWTEVEFDIAANSGSQRTGSIVFCLQDDESVKDTFSITQAEQPAPAGKIYLKFHDTIGEGDNFETINANDTYIFPWLTATGAWTVTSDVSWITPYSSGAWHGNSAVSDHQLWCSIEPNSGSTRQGILTAKLDGTNISNTYIVTQLGGGSTTTFLLSPSGTKNVDKNVGVQYLSVTSNASWRLNAGNGVKLNGASYITGTGNMSNIRMTFDINVLSTEKHNRVTGYTTSGTYKEVSLDVIQAGWEQEPFLDVHPTSLSYGASKDEEKTLTIECNVRWELDSYPSWLTPNKPGATGASSVVFTLNETNPGTTQRTGNIVISGNDVDSVTIPVTQAGATPQETISWQEVSPQSLRVNESITLHVVTNDSYWMLDKTGYIDNGAWYVSKSGFTVTIQKLTNVDKTLVLTASLRNGSTASFTITSKIPHLTLTLGAWRVSPTAQISGSFLIENEDEEGHTISNIAVKFLDANGNDLGASATFQSGNFINGGQTLSGTAVIATASVVSQYALKNATDIRGTMTLDSSQIIATARIGSTPPQI